MELGGSFVDLRESVRARLQNVLDDVDEKRDLSNKIYDLSCEIQAGKQTKLEIELVERLEFLKKDEELRASFSGSSLVIDTQVFRELIETNSKLESRAKVLEERSLQLEKAISGMRNSFKNAVSIKPGDERRAEVAQVPSKKEALKTAEEATNAAHPDRKTPNGG